MKWLKNAAVIKSNLSSLEINLCFLSTCKNAKLYKARQKLQLFFVALQHKTNQHEEYQKELS